MSDIKLSKEELIRIKEVYKSIMSYAAIGLFFRSGEIIGDIMSKDVPREHYFEELAKKLVEKGWVGEIEFSEDSVKVKDSAEVYESTAPTCHMLRGIIRKIYERYYETIVNVDEVKCESMGDPYCLFTVKKVG